MGSTSVTQLQQPRCNDTVATTETGGNIEGQTRQKFSQITYKEEENITTDTTNNTKTITAY